MRNLYVVGDTAAVPSSPASDVGVRPHGEALREQSVVAPELPPAVEHLRTAAAQALVDAYRRCGYLHAAVNPLESLAGASSATELDPRSYGLTATSPAGLRVHLAGALRSIDLPELLPALRASYCGAVGLDCAHLRSAEQRAWLYERFETQGERGSPGAERQREILKLLSCAEAYEQFQRAAFPRQKHFSLEGSESFIALLEAVLSTAAKLGVEEAVLGMPHRGRMNVLLNLLGLPPASLLSLFTDVPDASLDAWDIKDHLGYDTHRRTPHGEIRVSLVHNPSHLGSVSPVVCGMVRALHDRAASAAGRRIMPVLVHGDATFAAQGVIGETLNLSQTRGYGVGGTLHLILNNQIGSTIWNPRDARSTMHCADYARAIDAPIIHVHGEDIGAILAVAEIATEFRVRFGTDVVVNHVSYRRFGHFGGDDPTMTQPAMQRNIRNRPTLVQMYAEQLVRAGIAAPGEAAAFKQAVTDALASANASLATRSTAPQRTPISVREPHLPAVTSVPQEQLCRLLSRLADAPSRTVLHPTIEGLAQRWRALADREDDVVDWCCAENLAYATLLANGFNVRLTGLDIGRGSFFHRHHVWHDQSATFDGQSLHVGLRHVGPGQGSFSIFETPLSEEAVLGFEYGYSLRCGRDLVVWEAQFGDFVNNAQVMIDQFIASGERKWSYRSALTMLLPHGYDGGGPEHSSAYLGRFLQLCGEDNLQVVVPSTPAQLFHLLRRQALQERRTPLCVMTPKFWLHAHTPSYSRLSDCASASFQTLIDDATVEASRVTRAAVLSGKVYYTLLRERASQAVCEMPLLRVEQLYPFPVKALRSALARYPNLREVVWVQEETRNHGAWYLVREALEAALPEGVALRYAGRPPSAAAAVCNALDHKAEEDSFVAQALRVA